MFAADNINSSSFVRKIEFKAPEDKDYATATA